MSDLQHHDTSDADALIASYRRDAILKNIAASLIAISALLAVGWFIFGDSVKRAWRAYKLESAAASRRANMTELERVHAELLPRYIIGASNNYRDTPTRLEEPRAALAREPALLELTNSIADDLQDPEQLVERGDHLMASVSDWNKFMDAAGEPWWVDANIYLSPESKFFYLKTYKILADFDVMVGDSPYRTRMAARADSTNVVESFLGHTSPRQDGAIILADRLYDFSLREVWPLLGELPEDASPRARAFHAELDREARATMNAETLELLAAHSASRHDLVKTLDAIRSRRSCGSKFSITDLPWDGMPEDELDLLHKYAERDRYADCPSIKPEEVEIILESSQNLRDDEALKTAAEELVAHVAHAVTIHEARHAADHETAEAFTKLLPCTRCDELGLGRSARAELSAYLASFSSERSGYTALFQACGLDFTRPTPHVQALILILDSLDANCEAPPEDLNTRARQLEVELFGRSDTISTPDAKYPTSLELYK